MKVSIAVPFFALPKATIVVAIGVGLGVGVVAYTLHA